MKIRDITLTPIRHPAPHQLRWGKNVWNDMGGVIVQVYTDEGLVGIGDACAPVRLVRPLFEGIVKPLLVGENPLDVERLWEKMARGVTGPGAHADLIGGLDVALWDIVGKAANLPLYRLFGAYRDRVTAYAAPCSRQPEVILEELAGYPERGFKAVKLRLGLGPAGLADGPRDMKKDQAIVSGARELLGPNFIIGADADKTYDHGLAYQMASLVNELDLAWFEEPLGSNLPREVYVRDMLRLREIIRVPLSGGQNLHGPASFDGLLNTNAVDIIQPDMNHVGGLTAMRKVGHMAEGRNIACMPHVSCHLGSDIITMATAHALGAMPNGLWLCYQAYDTPLRTELLVEQPKLVDGDIVFTDRPGLGIELNQEVLKRFTVDG